ncbi:RNA polymerase sigma factor [Pseudobythopirellula maris]|uniref:RNA polymerase sigma factor n=1 Tax=Pseudobythopirellula maris TaxID=2527991 RepID=A0A5C5ZMJ3_9BACT|nr:sigma-70 family RNA polymerase sigma factor [Pseudobythopirellula maris]TWT88694.1 RNA polymerase sigma factor [Pseudobythopirellula maris]
MPPEKPATNDAPLGDDASYDGPSVEDRLSRIETLWTVVRQAHEETGAEGDTSSRAAARRAILDRYGGAVRRYALAVLRDAEGADEVYQEFALKFVRGDFGSADPQRGRFRAFVKTTVYRLVIDQCRLRQRNARRAGPMPEGFEPAAAPCEEEDHDAMLVRSWRDELLGKAWERLELLEAESGKPHHTVLRCRVEHPDLRSPELAVEFTQLLGKDVKAGAARVLLHRAREAFAELLLEEVAHSLDAPDRNAIEEELIALDLLGYCKPILERRPVQRGGA